MSRAELITDNPIIRLTLSEKEAEFLAGIMGNHTSGDCTNAEIAADIWQQLSNLGIDDSPINIEGHQVLKLI